MNNRISATSLRSMVCSVMLSLASISVAAEEIHVAAKNGDLVTIETLLANGVPVDQPSTRDSSTIGASPLLVATKWGKVDVVKSLLGAGADADYQPSDNGLTPLATAALSGRAEILEILLEHGANPDGSAAAYPPLHHALRLKRAKIVEILISNGASPKLTEPPISHLLAGADIERGRRLASFCKVCHGDLEKKETGTAAPVLWDIVGREKASQPHIEYSDAILGAGGVWTFDELNSFLARPGGFIPGTAMADAYTASEESRIDMIAYLRTLSDDPKPLP